MNEPRSSAPWIRLPRTEPGPFRLLATRFALASGAVFIALVAYVGRAGYTDAAGDGVSFLDALYYASVSVTTTGYGDITPVSDGARLVTTLVVTPARVLFLVLLVGTTVEILTERSRHVIRLRRWSRKLHDHVIICGYGTKGRSAVDALTGKGLDPKQIVGSTSALT
jgi:voltage-gated potassium channel